MRTTVAIVEGQGKDFGFEEVELDGPRDDELLVRIVASGLCHTDISLRDHLPAEMFPRVFGHEGAGVVEQVGSSVTGIEVGDHVVLSLRSCRECDRCRRGEVGYCDQTMLLNYMGMRIDGSTTYTRGDDPVYGSFLGQSSFSRHAIASPDNTIVVDPALDLTRLAPYGCGFQTGAGTVLNVLDLGPDDSLAVYGVGAVGLAALAAAAGRGVGTLVAVDLIRSRLEAAGRYGALGLNPAELGETTVVDRVKELTGGGATGAIDTTAAPTVIKQAAQALGVRGQLVTLGLGELGADLALDAVDIMQNGKVVRGSIEGDSDPLEMVPQLIEMAGKGTFDVDGLVETYAFEDINTAIEEVLAGRVVKPVLVW